MKNMRTLFAAVFVLIFASTAMGGIGAKPAKSYIRSNLKEYYLSENGIAGDSTDVFSDLQTFLSDKSNCRIVADTGAVYYMRIDKDSLMIPEGVHFDWRGSRIRARLSDTSMLFSAQNVNDWSFENATIYVDTVGGDAISGSGQHGTAISVGNYNTGTGSHGWRISNVTIYTEKPNGNGIFITGDSYNSVVEDVTFPTNTTTAIGVLCHWGGQSTIASDTLSGATTHPHDIEITRIRTDSMGYAGSAGIWLSACYGIEVSNCEFNYTKKNVVIGAGDYGFVLSDTSIYHSPEDIQGQGTKIRNVAGWKDSVGFTVSGYISPTRMASTLDTSRVHYPVVFEGCSSQGNDLGQGFLINYANGVVLRDCRATEHVNGVLVADGAQNTVVSGGQFFDNTTYGVQVDGAVNPIQTLIEGTKCWGNQSNAGIYVVRANRVTIWRNLLGDTLEADQSYGIYVNNTSANSSPVIAFNRIQGVKSGGYGIRVNVTSDIQAIVGNTFASTVTTPFVQASAVARNIDSLGSALVKRSLLDTAKVRAGRILNIPIQDTTGHIADGYLIAFDLTGGQMAWVPQSGVGSGDDISIDGTDRTDVDFRSGAFILLSDSTLRTWVNLDIDSVSANLAAAFADIFLSLSGDSAMDGDLNMGNNNIWHLNDLLPEDRTGQIRSHTNAANGYYYLRLDSGLFVLGNYSIALGANDDVQLSGGDWEALSPTTLSGYWEWDGNDLDSLDIADQGIGSGSLDSTATYVMGHGYKTSRLDPDNEFLTIGEYSAMSETDPTLTDDNEVIVGDGATPDPYVEWNGSTGINGRITHDESESEFVANEPIRVDGSGVGYFALGADSGTVTITIPAGASTYTFTFPWDNGDAGEYLKTDGSGTASWDTVAYADSTSKIDTTYAALIAMVHRLCGEDVTDSLGQFFDTAAVVDTSQALLALGLAAYFDTAGTVDTAQALIALSLAAYFDTAGVVDTAQALLALGLASYSVTTDLVLRDGSQALTANWAAGDFDITGLEKVEADTGAFGVLQGTGNNTYIADSLVLGAILDANGQDVVDVDSLQTASLVIGAVTVQALIEDSLDEYPVFSDIRDTVNQITHHFRFALADPNVLWDVDSLICIVPVLTEAITVTRIDITCDADPTTEPAMSLRFADNFITRTTPTTVDVITTTAGVTAITSGFDDATIPASNCIYLDMTAQPESALKSITFDISYTVDN